MNKNNTVSDMRRFDCIDNIPLLHEESSRSMNEHSLNIAAGFFTEAINLVALEKMSKEPNPANMSFKQIVDYADSINDRWYAGERELMERRDKNNLINYASLVIESYSTNKSGRWVNAEPIILESAPATLKYATRIIGGAWELGEQTIGLEPETAAEYALNILGERWLNRKNGALIEHKIIMKAKEDIERRKDSKCRRYAKAFFNNINELKAELRRFLLEHKSADDIDEENFWHFYETSDLSRLSSKQITSLVDRKIIKPSDLVIYAKEKKLDSWPEAEEAISRSGSASYDYASNIIKGPWPKGEPAMSRVSYIAKQYAQYVLKRPWPEGEESIKNDAHEAMDYARHFGKLWDDPVQNILLISLYPYYLTSFKNMTPEEVREKVIYDFDIETALENLPMINLFCEYVLGHRWLEIEDILKAVDPDRYKLYMRDVAPLGVG